MAITAYFTFPSGPGANDAWNQAIAFLLLIVGSIVSFMVGVTGWDAKARSKQSKP